MKHIYLHTSDIRTGDIFKEDPDFEFITQYPALDYHKTYQNEWGRIKTRSNYYHILLGEIKNNLCPWCNAEPEIVKIKNNHDVNDSFQIYMECKNCGSRGPKKNMFVSRSNQEETLKHVDALIEDLYSRITPWDKDLENRYET